MPRLITLRPADANETVQAWRVALEHKDGPVALILTRQELPEIDQDKYAKASGVEQGAYILSDSENELQLILMGSGSEVHLLLEAQEKLKQESIHARVVSFPSWELFDAQSDEYKQKIFPRNIRKRLAVEAGSPIGWHKYVTDDGDVIGVTKFGESAPGPQVMKEYGFSVENVIAKAKHCLNK